MKTILLASRNYIFLLFPGILLCNCSSPADKIVHKSFTVEIKEMRFQPAELTVQAGDTVTWVNHDFVAHDITEESQKEWSSSPLAAGKSWSRVFIKSVDYYCSIHQVMKGKIHVQ